MHNRSRVLGAVDVGVLFGRCLFQPGGKGIQQVSLGQVRQVEHALNSYGCQAPPQ